VNLESRVKELEGGLLEAERLLALHGPNPDTNERVAKWKAQVREVMDPAPPVPQALRRDLESGFDIQDHDSDALPLAEHAAKIVAEESAKAHEAGKEAVEDKTGKRGPGKSLHGIAGLVAMLAMQGAFADMFEEADEVEDSERMQEIFTMLEAAELMKPIPGPRPGTLAGIVAIPKSFGKQFGDDVESAVRSGNLTALRVLLTSAGLIP
jgi:hypothetical protein